MPACARTSGTKADFGFAFFRWCAPIAGTVHFFAMDFIQTGRSPLFSSEPPNPFGLLAVTAFFCWPYWILPVASLRIRSLLALWITLGAMIFVGTWEWFLVIQSTRSTKIFSIYAVPIKQFFVGAATLLGTVGLSMLHGAVCRHFSSQRSHHTR